MAFRQLRNIQSKSIKAGTIRYQKYEMQEYLKSASMNKEEMTMLTNMRSNCIKGIKANFKNMHKLCLHCPLKCNTENPQEDTQEHILVCSRLDGSNMDLELIHASSVEQSELARQFCGLMNQRTTLLEEQSDSSSCCRPGANLDPSFLGAPAADDIL